MSALQHPEKSTRFFTIGYGGRSPEDFLVLLTTHGVRSIADVRIRPDRASMGAYTKAKTNDKGIERLLNERGISYHHILELGNLFLGFDDWRPHYRELLRYSGDLLVSRLELLRAPFCLLCAEKRVSECHRSMIADHLVTTRGWIVDHIE
jgi:uncharacterized protein (DUF488 family)